MRDGIDQYKAAADITAYLQGKVSESSDAHFSLMAGLMYGVLVSAERREEYFNYVSLLTKDSYQNFVELLGSVSAFSLTPPHRSSTTTTTSSATLPRTI